MEWLLRRERALLADEMGLGKTIQVVSALRLLIHEMSVVRTLVVCPKSLVRNWVAEIRRWAPELECTVVGAIDEEPATLWAEAFSTSHVVIVNYETLRHERLSSACRVDLLVADEAHRIRNIEAGVSIGIRRVTSRRTWALTGTPIERSLDDLANLFAFIDPMRFSTDDSKKGGAALRASAQPYTLRRTRDTVLGDLPPVIEHPERIELAPLQRAAYDKALRDTETSDSVLVRLAELRQICEFDPSSLESSKVNRVAELLESIAELREKAIVFSFLLQPLRLLGNALDERGMRGCHVFLEGMMSSSERAAVVESFKTKPKPSILLASMRVASEGLTLTEANHVIFLNQWWNPSTNSQARDRVVRIGQTRKVFVYTFTCENTVEEGLERILLQKGDTYRSVVDRLVAGEDSRQVREFAARVLEACASPGR